MPGKRQKRHIQNQKWGNQSLDLRPYKKEYCLTHKSRLSYTHISKREFSAKKTLESNLSGPRRPGVLERHQHIEMHLQHIYYYEIARINSVKVTPSFSSLSEVK
jgi:hypothetical protein